MGNSTWAYMEPGVHEESIQAVVENNASHAKKSVCPRMR